MELGELKRRIAQGSLAGLVRVSLAVPLYLITTPFILDRLGSDMFGLWSLGTIIISITTLTDFGFKSALVYFVVTDRADHRTVNVYFNVAYLAYSGMALTVLLATILFGDVIAVDLFQVPEQLRDQARFVLWITAIGFGLRFVSAPYQAILEAHQEHAKVQTSLLGWLLAHFTATLIALSISPTIYALGAATLFSNALLLITFWAQSRRQYPFVRVTPSVITTRAIKSMLRYGSAIHLATILIAAREPLLKVLIARTYGLPSVATFEVIYRLCVQCVALVNAPLLASFAASALLSRGRLSELEQVLRPMFGFCIAVFVPAVVFFMSFSEPLLQFWLGTEFQDYKSLPIVFTAFAIYYITEAQYKAIEASGLSRYSALIQLMSLTVTIATFVLTAKNEWAIGASIFAGFATFSLSNAVVFRQRFPSVRLCNIRQCLWLLGPVLGYIALKEHLPAELTPGIFALYACAHISCVNMGNIFNFMKIARKVGLSVRIGK